mgnify:CR=1 FL=1|jgi:Na+/H+-dicarboxylate symporter
MKLKSFFSTTWLILYAFVFGIITAYKIPKLLFVASGVSKLFINILQLISLPLIFLSIVSVISGMESFAEMKLLGKKVLKYTLLTTVIAASIALFIFKVINPLGITVVGKVNLSKVGSMSAYLSFFEKIIPSNFIEAFGDNTNVAAVVFLALLLSIAILSLPSEHKERLHSLFSSLFAAILKITQFIIYLMPFGVWAFVCIFIRDMRSNATGVDIKDLSLYVLCIVIANIIQGFIVLPLLLKSKGISPVRNFKGVAKALMIAFFSKSSTTALPVTMETAEKNLGISKRVSRFALPLCSTVNMNGCAAFILITVLFVGISNGFHFSFFDMIAWIFIATFAAVGNASVPMGCYFMSSAFLASMGIPLHLMGIILPIHSLLDMPETALNVWSDTCVAAIVDKELKE